VDGDFIPNPDGNIWMNQKFKISTGLILDDVPYYISRGIYLCSEPEISSDVDGGVSTSIQFLDKFSTLNSTLGGSLENTYIIPAGTNIPTAISAILTEAGEVKPPLIDISIASEVTPYTITKDASSNYGEIIIELAKMLSFTTYFDAEGYLRFEPPSNLDVTGSSWDFSTDEITYISSRHRWEFSKVYNNIVVIGSSINGATVRGTASDTNATSPTRIALIGKKTKVIEDDLISTVDLANQRASGELLSAISLVEVTDVDCMPVDILQAGQICTITDINSDLDNTRFLIKSISFPLGIDGQQSMSCWKGRSLD
jgi:hypothetical protein